MLWQAGSKGVVSQNGGQKKSIEDNTAVRPRHSLEQTLEILCMANKRKPTKKRAPNQTITTRRPDEDRAVTDARTVMRPTVQAAVTLKEYSQSFGELDLLGLVDSLTEQTEAANGGDLNRGEVMLAAQAHTLDAIFNNLAQRAINVQRMDHLDCYLKLALRAQSQCRATWETLATIKNPPLAGYVGQANISHGHQQVNNAPCTASEASRARENQNLQNKLLEEKGGERLDTGTTGTAGRDDSAMASLGEFDRAEDIGR
jgi:hypothetical protein